MKPRFDIDISPTGPSALEALEVLARLPHGSWRHVSLNLREPLGIYNVSITRVCEKLISLCERLETYFSVSNSLDILHEQVKTRKELIDYIELSIYAAAEHVDDLESISKGFFTDEEECKMAAAYKRFYKRMKAHKKYVTSIANAIKHQQSRIRLFSVEFNYGGIPGCLHGFFVEGVENGVVCPSRIFHSVREVFSITSFIWEILLFLLWCSRDLKEFLIEIVPVSVSTGSVRNELFSKVVIGAARLPLYNFDEEHPFSTTTVGIFSSNGDGSKLDSGIYGSIRRRWVKSQVAQFGVAKTEYEGDGSTKSFKFARPKVMGFQHWQ